MSAVENVSDGKGTTTTAGEGSDGKGVKMITLISSDNESFEVSEAAASLSETISNMIEDGCAEGGIPLPNVSASTLGKVLEYCNKHAAAVSSEAGSSTSDATAAASSSSNDAASSSSSAAATSGKKEQEDLKSFDKEFIDVEMEMLFQIQLASNYLNVKELLALASQTIADRIKDMSPEEVRTIFGIQNDFDPEEEAKIRSENAWAFDK